MKKRAKDKKVVHTGDRAARRARAVARIVEIKKRIHEDIGIFLKKHSREKAIKMAAKHQSWHKGYDSAEMARALAEVKLRLAEIKVSRSGLR